MGFAASIAAKVVLSFLAIAGRLSPCTTVYLPDDGEAPEVEGDCGRLRIWPCVIKSGLTICGLHASSAGSVVLKRVAMMERESPETTEYVSGIVVFAAGIVLSTMGAARHIRSRVKTWSAPTRRVMKGILAECELNLLKTIIA